MSKWTDLDKAQWVLENGPPEIVWVYECANEIVYRRPMRNTNVPPWVSLDREIHRRLFNNTEE